MGFIKRGLLVLASLFLFFALLAGNTFLTLNLSLDYDTIQPELVSLTKSVLEEQAGLDDFIKENYPAMELYCQVYSEFPFDYGGYSFTIPCSVIEQGSDYAIEYGVNEFFLDIYYKEYDCEFWDCFGQEEIPLFIVSKQAKNYWNKMFYFALIASIVLIALMFLLTEKKTNWPILVGALLIFASLPFAKLDVLANSILSIAGYSVPFYIINVFSIFLSKAWAVFLIGIISGAIFVGLGIVLKIFKIGFQISNLFSKGKKDKKENKKIPKVKKKSK